MLPPLERLDRISSGFQESQLLFVGIRLGLFESLGERSLSLPELKAGLEADPRGLRILCDALVGMGLLEKEGDRYRNSDEARTYLLADSPHSRVHRFLHGARQYERWAGLYDAVLQGRPTPEGAGDARLARDEAAFAQAMFDVAKGSASDTLDHLELEGARTLLDVGGGPGAYVIEAAQRSEALRAAVFDTPGTLEVTRENVRAAGLEERIRLIPGDAFEDDLQGPWDVVLLSNIVHIFSPEKARTLVQRGASALGPGGRLVVKDFLLEPDRTRPAGAALFAVNMLVSTEQGDCYTAEVLGEWMERAGLVLRAPIRITPMSSLLIGTRAA